MRIINLILLLSILFISSYGFSQNYIGEKKLYYGVAYYPEAWDFSEIENDIKYMKEAKINIVRMSEFSWSLMEPEEGLFDFEWLHKIIDKLHENGIDVVLGTPTATPPAWVWEKYPKVYTLQEDGTRKTHGARRNCSYSSEKYRQLSEKICEKMANEFGSKSGVIGWQTDNEFHHEFDYSDETKKRWHDWLKNRYKTIDSINNLWCLNLWSQHYDKFEQIPMPVTYIWHHPSLQLAWFRFNTDMVIEFQDIQIKAIRKYSKLPITHDGMPSQKLDYEKLFADLDFMAVNNYHSFEAYDRIQSNYDRQRGYGKGYHWLFETAPNNSGGGKKGNTWFLHQPEGSFHAAIMMNYALGGQGTMFWLWRQHRAGHEMPHGSILSAWGKPCANFDDIKEMGENLDNISDFMMNTPVTGAEVGIFWSHENLAMFTVEEYANGIKYYTDWTYRFYRGIADAYIHRDVLNQSVDISRYKVLFAPMLPMISEELKPRLQQWVENGGILILGPMSGYRNEEWASFTNHAYGDFGKWTGIDVDSRIPIGTKRRPAEIPLYLNFTDDLECEISEASLWSEALSSEKGTVLATYESGMHNGKPAIIENKIGKGKVVVLGCDPGKKAYKKLALRYAKEAGIEPLATGDESVVIVPRKNKKTDAIILINLENKPANIHLTNFTKGNELLKNETITNNKLNLSPYEIKIIKK